MRWTTRWIQITVSVIFSIFLWYSIKLGQTYSTEVRVPVRYVNLPPQVKLTRDLPQVLEARIRGRGHQLLLPSLEFSQDTALVDLHLAIPRGYLVTNRIRRQILRHLPDHTHLEALGPDTIYVEFEEKIYRQVPIRRDYVLKAEEGYLPVEPPVLRPDSVVLMGTMEEIGKIDEWPTQAIEVSTRQRNPAIPLQASDGISVKPGHVRLYFESQRYTEGEVRVRVVAQNIPANNAVRLLPEWVTVRYLMPFERYRELQSEDFQVTIDLAEAHSDVFLLVPRVETQEQHIRALRTEPRFIRYVLRNLSQ